ncbi:5' nucleotidase, NT5C type [Desulfolucanica intricata]|uniref:5' nucleotidase, NT5C type n=1 Tax=Desulfolucanica intricata TaxID=1285191 RepID=UPI00082CB84E|nr:hypothetical protein [Desulfolucanica intricata]
MKKIIGIDIDGVIANTQPVIIDELNQYFGKNYTIKDFINFDPVEKFNIDRQELYRFIMVREGKLINNSAPMPGSAAAINQLISDYQIYIISARTPTYYEDTLNWLKKYKISFDHLVLLGDHDKRQACIDAGVQLFIEDNLNNALQISSCGIPVYLYDATYNQGNLPPLVHRKFSWQEILAGLKKDFE